MDDKCSLWFGDLVENNSSVLKQLWDWLGIDQNLPMKALNTLPPTMATTRPRQLRWFDNSEVILPIVNTPTIQNMMRRLHDE